MLSLEGCHSHPAWSKPGLFKVQNFPREEFLKDSSLFLHAFSESVFRIQSFLRFQNLVCFFRFSSFLLLTYCKLGAFVFIFLHAFREQSVLLVQSSRLRQRTAPNLATAAAHCAKSRHPLPRSLSQCTVCYRGCV